MLSTRLRKGRKKDRKKRTAFLPFHALELLEKEDKYKAEKKTNRERKDLVRRKKREGHTEEMPTADRGLPPD